MGVWSRPPPNGPCWHVNYLELKAIKTLQAPHNFYLSLKECKLGGLPTIRIITRHNFLSPICRTAQLLVTEPLFLWPCNDLPALWSPQAQNVVCTPVSLSIFEPLMYMGPLIPSCMWISPTCICNWIWLSSLVSQHPVGSAERTLGAEHTVFLQHRRNAP